MDGGRMMETVGLCEASMSLRCFEGGLSGGAAGED